MNRTLVIALTFLVALGGGILLNTGKSTTVGPNLGAANAQDARQVDTSSVEEMSMGNPDASVTVIEYASFTCPHCGQFHQDVLKDLKTNYIDTGKINFIYREVYFDRFGLWAGMVARCGGSEKYFGLTDLIYKDQSDWLAGGDPTLIVANLRKLGKTAGLSDDQLDVCLNDSEQAKAMVAAFQVNSEADNITSTPSFVINGENYSNMSYQEFSEILDQKLGE